MRGRRGVYVEKGNRSVDFVCLCSSMKKMKKSMMKTKVYNPSSTVTKNSVSSQTRPHRHSRSSSSVHTQLYSHHYNHPSPHPNQPQPQPQHGRNRIHAHTHLHRTHLHTYPSSQQDSALLRTRQRSSLACRAIYCSLLSSSARSRMRCASRGTRW